jgi:hypothetical protein
MDNKLNPKANILVCNPASVSTQKTILAHFSKFGEIQKCKLEKSFRACHELPSLPRQLCKKKIQDNYRQAKL